MMVTHANFSDGKLHIWAETVAPVAVAAAATDTTQSDGPPPHPGVADLATVRQLLDLDKPAAESGWAWLGNRDGGLVENMHIDDAELTLFLPAINGEPMPSPQAAHWIGRTGDEHDETEHARLARFTVPALAIAPGLAHAVLERLEAISHQTHEAAFDEAQLTETDDTTDNDTTAKAPSAVIGDSARFYLSASRLARSLLAEQRFVPMVIQDAAGGLRAAWRPWLSDDATAERVGTLLEAMPASARAHDDEHEHQGWPILTNFMGAMIDGWCRRVLSRESMREALEGRRVIPEDPHVRWLGGLLDATPSVDSDAASGPRMMRAVRHWIGGLEERGISSAWRLCLVLNEPLTLDDDPSAAWGAPDDSARWAVTFKLRSSESATVEVDAEDIWAIRSDSVTIDGLRLDEPKEVLLSELARAARLYQPLETALRETEPMILELTTKQAYEFLREFAPLLVEQGFAIETPEWWDTPAARIGGRLKIDSPDLDANGMGLSAPGAVSAARLGLNALVSYEWNLAVGDTPLTLNDFERLAQEGSPLVRINGQWVEIRPEDVEKAVEFLHENPGGKMRIGEALRMAFGGGMSGDALPILGVDATGWAAMILGDMEEQSMPIIDTPKGFKGDLRPYQRKGLSWLAFLDAIGLGPCLADDMGLGKTIQLLAMLVNEREQAEAARAGGHDVETIGPTLLVVPMSIVGNWLREARKFTPSLRVLVHHGAERAAGDSFVDKAHDSDLVITTYALAHRDRESIGRVEWRRVVLDEAQNIKNASAKQSVAVRELDAPRRIALTGTPLENRLSELWSIVDFCNPGFLGSSGEFRRVFSVPIERYRDGERAGQLRQLVRPFILRRLKTDPTVISDLPEKIEMKEYCRLTSEQAALYESTVRDMLSEVERSEGIRRRGVVLTTLIRLKQVCNHPALLARDEEADNAPAVPNPSRSGKCVRLIEMLDEVISSNEQALIFTQFRQMGHLLSAMLRHAFDRDVMFLHGGVPQGQREKLVERFQKADGSAPIFILSLKAGGVGLNLTAASHVFHFDRWWNPAVENQATDRAFRIGQDKRVNVHKFIVGGTLEERIDQMIESKVALAEDIIGSGEDWLTELTTTQLRDVLTLRPDAMEDDE